MKITTEKNWKIILTNRRYLIESILLFAASAGILIFAALPQVQVVFELKNKVDSQRPIVTTLDTKLSNLSRVEVSQEFGQALLVNNALPSRKPLMELLISLQSSADQSGAEIINFQVSPGELATDSAQLKSNVKRASPDYDFLEMEVELEGSLDNVQTFLTRVEQFTPFTTIAAVSIELPQQSQQFGTQSENILTANLKIRTYYFTKSVQSSVESVLPSLSDKDREVLNALAAFQTITVNESQNIEGGGNEELFGDVDKLFE